MKKFSVACLAFAMAATAANAGGLLTNTNQSVTFLRNPARDGAIGIDGVYSNPAGVIFLGEGLHMSLNWQSAMQKRKVHTTNPLFLMNVNNPYFGRITTQEYDESRFTNYYEGTANAPVIPSVQAAYNKGKWSFQFNFSVTGGGGKCEFDNGLGSFEGAVAQIAKGLQPFGAQGYDAQYYMRGKQFYFGFTLGAAYKVTDNLSVYGGLRALYGTASYKAKISDIMVRTAQGDVDFPTFLDASKAYVSNTLQTLENIRTNLPQVIAGLDKANAGLAQLEPVKDVPGYAEQYQAVLAQQQQLLAMKGQMEQALPQLEAAEPQLQAAGPQLDALDAYRNGVNLQSDQTGFGIAPIIGVDYKIGNFNFAAKYDFRVKMSMKNESTLKEAMAIDAVNQFRDGTSVREDSPALLALGAQWSALPNLRLNAGYHHFYDKDSKKYGNKQELLSGGTNEYLGGVEFDAAKKLTLSGGFQITNYGLTDEYMSDLSFVVNSWTFGLGAKYQISDHVAVNAAYFQTNYGDYDTKVDAAGVKNSFTRTNNVVGVGVDLTF